MTLAAQFTRVPHPAPLPAQRRQEILAEPGFGRFFTDHMVSMDYVDGQWTNGRVEPYGPLSMDPATMVFHYGQAIFEGLKAYRQADGSIATFRVDANAARFRRSAARMAMAQLPEELFIESIRQLLEVDADWVLAAAWRGRAVPAPVHVLHRGRPGREARRRLQVPAARRPHARTSRAA